MKSYIASIILAAVFVSAEEETNETEEPAVLEGKAACDAAFEKAKAPANAIFATCSKDLKEESAEFKECHKVHVAANEPFTKAFDECVSKSGASYLLVGASAALIAATLI